MAKQKTIKLKVAEKKKAKELQRDITIARYGQETAQRIHFEAEERLWEYLRERYPDVAGTKAAYSNGVITYTPKGEQP